MGVDWRDTKTVEAIRGYVRIAFGVAFAIILLYMLLVGRIDPIAVLKALTGILAIGRVTDGLLLMLVNKTTS
jgi:hypothetical protein